MAAQYAPSGASPRQATMLWALLVAVVVAMCWRPPLAYPETGVWLTAILAGALALSAGVRFMAGGTAASSSRIATICGFAMVVHALVLWSAGGRQVVGAENVVTLLACAAAAVSALSVVRTVQASAAGDTTLSRLLSAGMFAICAGAIVCGLHATAQRAYIYDRALADLIAQVGSTEPNPIQQALMHHFRLKRVASVWGDPNALGCFMALALAPALWLTLNWRESAAGVPRAGARVVGVCSVCACIAGIVLSGSRGAILDALAAGVLTWWAWRGLRCAGRGTWAALNALPAIVVATLLLLSAGVRAQETSATVGTSGPAALSALLSRSDTLRERAYYFQVGWGIVREHPVLGGGPGAVDLNFGRLKPPEARESKYLHNWMLQVAAEYGTVGLLLSFGFVIALLGRAVRLLRHPLFGAYAVMCAVFVLDALYQLSFNQRELMVLFGFNAGVVLAAPRSADASSTTGQDTRRRRLTAALLLAALLVSVAIPQLAASAAKNRAEMQLGEGDNGAALEALDRAEWWSPRDPAIPAARAPLVGQRLGPTAGVRELARAVAMQPRSASLRAQLSRWQAEAGDLPAAELSLREAIEFYPSNPEYRHQHSLLLERKGDLKSAVDEARLAVRHGYLYLDRYRATLQSLEAKLAAAGAKP